jgi:diketogulonate reductase-like aldo/keto reductase
MNNLSSYCGLCDAKTRAYDKDLHVQETWRELELLLDQEKIRSVGVSNFQVSDLEELIDSMEKSDTLPHVNQCEFHPCQNPEELVKFCLTNQIQFGGFCPLAKGQLILKCPFGVFKSIKKQ